MREFYESLSDDALIDLLIGNATKRGSMVGRSADFQTTARRAPSGQVSLAIDRNAGCGGEFDQSESAGTRGTNRDRMGIEQRFNISLIAALALREKQIQQNYRPIIAVHKWFARRPGSLFRGLILAEFGDRPLLEM